MNFIKLYMFVPAQLPKKFVRDMLYTLKGFNCPILRLRRPILPRA